MIGDEVPVVINWLKARCYTMVAITGSRRFPMGKVNISLGKGKIIFVGIDVHKRNWTVTVLCEEEELYHAVIGSSPEGLIKILKRFEAKELYTV